MAGKLVKAGLASLAVKDFSQHASNKSPAALPVHNITHSMSFIMAFPSQP